MQWQKETTWLPLAPYSKLIVCSQCSSLLTAHFLLCSEALCVLRETYFLLDLILPSPYLFILRLTRSLSLFCF